MPPDHVDGVLSIVCFAYLSDAEQLQRVRPDHEPERGMIVDDQDSGQPCFLSKSTAKFKTGNVSAAKNRAIVQQRLYSSS
ncbi:hypothetical protein [Paraburkholderia saeva]|uniref:hypothetical protein n=1 Tax=Paraburkholderia saeva TaxID=2777537 RepID=UPI001E36A221|nr:hypothetical protein [Paraburkholderia saeva]